MAARMKVEDRCCKKKQRQRWAMIYLDPKGLRLPSFPLLFLPGEARDKREGGGRVEDVHKMEKKEGCEARGRKECGIGVVKAAGFLDIIY